ncbi:MAG: cytochrome c biogenesis protein CcsA, partial [Cytophagales bacterium]|nr:cytochrome c biogenesis protein CcsA [Cytophagales bacterium]
MTHTLIGDIGHFLVIVSLVTAIIASLSFTLSSFQPKLENEWSGFARSFFYVHFASVIGVVVTLFLIIYNQYYEYHYAWEHSSRSLPTHYMISCFWEGQEGSFLLWIFWNGLLGTIIIFTNKYWQSPVMAIFCAVQAFLASMILGIIVFDLKIGSSPFILLRDYMVDAPVFKMNPNYVPADGTGLNPLLQNYWMVIHPPTLFLGFATTLVPFAFCIAGLWKKNYIEWIRPALPWSLVAGVVLGTGILMGGYWAYETLNFGGYWNWDPVENAVYVPWLVLVGAIHTMLIYKNSTTSLKSAIILTITVFILILYSTFLTRSGILGNASVHSFTDLGMSGQLLVYLLSFTVLAIVLMVVRWKEIPTDTQESSLYSREFWIFIGIAVLCLAAFQVILMTSVPVYNTLLSNFGIKSRVAPPADQVKFYGEWQLWFSVFIALLSGTAQFFYWKKMDKTVLGKVMYWPTIITLLIDAIIIVVGNVNTPSYMVLLTASVYTLVANATILWSLFKNNVRLAGGSIAHIGIGIMLIGILFSAGYSKVVSLNNSGLLYSKEFSEEMNRENILLFTNEPQKMGTYNVTFLGSRVEADGYPGFVD